MSNSVENYLCAVGEVATMASLMDAILMNTYKILAKVDLKTATETMYEKDSYRSRRRLVLEAAESWNMEQVARAELETLMALSARISVERRDFIHSFIGKHGRIYLKNLQQPAKAIDDAIVNGRVKQMQNDLHAMHRAFGRLGRALGIPRELEYLVGDEKIYL